MDEESPPFDARQDRMCEDQAGPRAAWKTSSLIGELQDVLLQRFHSNQEKRAEYLRRFDAASRELTRRGLDAESLVRYGMMSEVLGPMLALLLVSHILPRRDSGKDLRDNGVDIEGWRLLLNIPDNQAAHTFSQTHEVVVQVSGKIFPPLLNWVRNADLDSLFQLTLPDSEEFWAPARAASDEGSLRHQYRWLVERFTESYLNQWSLPSLHLEYRWQQDIDPISFPAEIMKDRVLPMQKLAAEIAYQAVVNSSALSETPAVSFMGELQDHASTLLQEGKYSDAAALFRFAVLQWPNDAKARNNLGFCLLPEDAAGAQEPLNSAARMGYEPYAINAYNRMCCYLKLHQPRTALAIAKEYWTERPDELDTEGLLWEMTPDGDLNLATSALVRLTMAQLVISVARLHGWSDEEQVWTKRAVDLISIGSK
ncbi:hypothetical protein AB0O34_08915 [Sphaerisporangium sp. NPDC088356]|uniref:tetratricopeptide repeat protein n=1 Tax=Sphaerisporangium sp. NPDC088356 TaxID=3154871 RepID=UPI0034452444